jgi:PAS domain S-box-containing protein
MGHISYRKDAFKRFRYFTKAFMVLIVCFSFVIKGPVPTYSSTLCNIAPPSLFSTLSNLQIKDMAMLEYALDVMRISGRVDLFTQKEDIDNTSAGIDLSAEALLLNFNFSGSYLVGGDLLRFFPCVVKSGGTGSEDRRYWCCIRKSPEGEGLVHGLFTEKEYYSDGLRQDLIYFGAVKRAERALIEASISSEKEHDEKIRNAIRSGHYLIVDDARYGNVLSPLYSFLSLIGAIELLEDIRGYIKEQKVLIITGTDERCHLSEAHAGARGIYLPAYVDSEELSSALCHEVFAKAGFTHEENTLLQDIFESYVRSGYRLPGLTAEQSSLVSRAGSAVFVSDMADIIRERDYSDRKGFRRLFGLIRSGSTHIARDNMHNMLKKFGIKRTAKKVFGRSGPENELEIVKALIGKTMNTEKEIPVLCEDILNFLGYLDVVDAGAIYLFEDLEKEIPSIGKGKDLVMTAHYGVSDVFSEMISRYGSGSLQVRKVRGKEPFFMSRPRMFGEESYENGEKISREEGLTFLAVFPLTHKDEVIGALTLGSKRAVDVRTDLKLSISNIADQLSGGIALRIYQLALERNREKLQRTLSNANIGTWEWDFHNDRMYFSSEIARMLGYGQEELVNSKKAWFGIIHPEDRNTLKKELDMHMAGVTEKFGAEYRMFTKQGEVKWFKSEGRITKAGADGEPLEALGTHRDITQRKEYEIALAGSEKEFEEIFQGSPVGLAVLDHNGRISRVNRECLNIFGADEKRHIAGRDLFRKLNVFNPDSREIIGRIGSNEMDIILKYKDLAGWGLEVSPFEGKRIVSCTMLFFGYNEETLPRYLLRLDDITEKVRMQNDLKDAYQRLQEKTRELLMAERSKVSTELVARSAHEILNPASNILMMLENCFRKVEKGADLNKDEMLKLMNLCSAEIQRIVNITSKSLALSRASAVHSAKEGGPDMSPSSLKQVVLNTLGMRRSQINIKGIDVKLDLPEEPLMVMADKVRLHQAFDNILKNAIFTLDESYEKGITISLGEIKGPSGERFARVSFSDTGSGIPEEMLRKIWKPLKTGNGAGMGAGIGLAIVREVAEEHGGEARVESVYGQGATFHIDLPLLGEDTEAIKKALEEADPSAYRRFWHDLNNIISVAAYFEAKFFKDLPGELEQEYTLLVKEIRTIGKIVAYGQIVSNEIKPKHDELEEHLEKKGYSSLKEALVRDTAGETADMVFGLIRVYQNYLSSFGSVAKKKEAGISAGREAHDEVRTYSQIQRLYQVTGAEGKGLSISGKRKLFRRNIARYESLADNFLSVKGTFDREISSFERYDIFQRVKAQLARVSAQLKKLSRMDAVEEKDRGFIKRATGLFSPARQIQLDLFLNDIAEKLKTAYFGGSKDEAPVLNIRTGKDLRKNISIQADQPRLAASLAHIFSYLRERSRERGPDEEEKRIDVEAEINRQTSETVITIRNNFFVFSEEDTARAKNKYGQMAAKVIHEPDEGFSTLFAANALLLSSGAKMEGGNFREGSLIRLIFPYTEDMPFVEKRTVERDRIKPGDALPGRSNIILADDEDILRENMADRLKEDGYNVFEAVSVGDAYDLVLEMDSAGINIDAAVFDITMPADRGRGLKDGMALAEGLRKAGYGFPVILSSGHISGIEEDDAMFEKEKRDKGVFQAVLPKPVSFGRMTDTILNLIHGRSHSKKEASAIISSRFRKKIILIYGDLQAGLKALKRVGFREEDNIIRHASTHEQLREQISSGDIDVILNTTDEKISDILQGFPEEKIIDGLSDQVRLQNVLVSVCA